MFWFGAIALFLLGFFSAFLLIGVWLAWEEIKLIVALWTGHCWGGKG